MEDIRKNRKPKTRELAEWRVPLEEGRMIRFPDMVIAGIRVEGNELVIERVQWRHENGVMQVQTPWES